MANKNDNLTPKKPRTQTSRQGPTTDRKKQTLRSQRCQATIDVRATERFLRWSLKRNQQAIDALTHQREALLAALEVVTGRHSQQ